MIDRDCGEYQHSLHDLLVGGIDAEQIERVADGLEQHHADDGPPDCTFTPEDAGTAHDHRGDGRQFQANADVCLGGAGAARRQDAGESGADAGHDVGEGLDRTDSDPDETGCFRVPADGVQGSTQRGASQCQPEDQRDGSEDPHGHLCAQKGLGSERLVLAVGDGHDEAAGNEQGNAAEHDACGERPDEGIDPGRAHDQRVESTEQRTYCYPHGNSEPRVDCSHLGRHDRGQREHGSRRQVEDPRNDAEGHPDRDQSQGSGLIEEVQPVPLGQEAIALGGHSYHEPEMRLLAETSGKNAMVITPNADIDLAVADLVDSAFGHSGQKCSAASLAICVGEAYDSPRLRRQLADAVAGLRVGPSTDLATTVGPVIAPPQGKLLRALTHLDNGEEWMVEPRRLDDLTWTPGVRLGVQPGSWFARTECFGPVLGLMRAETLTDAVAVQNSGAYGLTGGIHTLDPAEIRQWTDTVEVGNAYINRGTTGAIVRRQPFGGWKKSSVGPGAKAGGPNYLAQLGTWHPVDNGLSDDEWPAAAEAGDEAAWKTEFGVEHDPTGLFCESNVLRYRPLPRMVLRVEADAAPRDVQRVRAAARRCNVALIESRAAEETAASFAARLDALAVQRVRVVGTCSPELRAAGNEAGVHIAADPVTAEGRIELLHYLREQSVTCTTHRYGNVL